MYNANINSIWHTTCHMDIVHTNFSIQGYVWGHILIVFMTHVAGRTKCACGPPFAHPCIRPILMCTELLVIESCKSLLCYLRYSMAHIWACPPCEGDDYIFNCHPPDMKIPKPKRLQDWYKKMLDRAILERIVVDYKVCRGVFVLCLSLKLIDMCVSLLNKTTDMFAFVE